MHFAVAGAPVPQEGALTFSLRDVFDVPDLATTNDDIVNGTRIANADDRSRSPRSPLSGSTIRWPGWPTTHATDPAHFQNHVLFTNYQFYVRRVRGLCPCSARRSVSGYRSFVAPGNLELTASETERMAGPKMPQMPAYHMKRPDGQGISLVNIGVGPSNAKTATDHIAVLRPHAWLMVGHCAGLRNSQSLGRLRAGACLSARGSRA